MFRCTRLGKVFNADLAAACNILFDASNPEPWEG